MRHWSSPAESETASRNFQLFYNVSDGHWRATDNSADYSGVDANGATQHIASVWSTCYVTDGAYSGFSDLGDSAIGLGLLMWNGSTSTLRSCILVLRD